MIDKNKRDFFKEKATGCPQSLPWLKNPEQFTEGCTRCQQCLTVCETDIIIQGDGGFPCIDFQKGECTFCYACAKVCPEPLFTAKEQPPWQQVIQINPSCLAKRNVDCRSCADVCEPQAIRFRFSQGHVATPLVDENSCTGCGACLSYCPVSAILIKAMT